MRSLHLNNSKVLSAIATIGLVVLLALLFPHIVQFSKYLQSVMTYPYVWALTENENMLFIHGITSGQNFYHYASSDSFYYFVYPPFFHLIAAAASKVLGFTITIPRIISLISLFAFGTTLYMFFKEKLSRTENVFLSLLLFGFTISMSPYAKYFVLARVDLLAYAFAFGSLYFAWKVIYLKQDQKYYFLLTGALALAALFTKQSTFFPYLLIVFLTFFADNRTHWVKFGSYLGAATLATFLLLQLVTGGGFWSSLALASEIYGKFLNSTEHLLRLQDIFISHFWPLLLGMLLLIILTLVNLRNEKRIPFSHVAFVAIYLNFLVTGGNQGAEHNTLIPLLFGIMLVLKELYTISPRYISLTLFFLVCALQVLTLRSTQLPYLLPSTADKENQAILVETLKAGGASLWVLGDRIDYAILLSGKNSPLEASTHNVALEAKGTQDYANAAQVNLLERLKTGQIDTAVTTITHFGKKELLNYIEMNGQIVQTIKINYLDAPELLHKVYRLNSKP